MSKKILICHMCGGVNVMRDAWAIWNVDTQEWELGNVFDAAYCEDCAGETSLEEADLPEELWHEQ